VQLLKYTSPITDTRAESVPLCRLETPRLTFWGTNYVIGRNKRTLISLRSITKDNKEPDWASHAGEVYLYIHEVMNGRRCATRISRSYSWWNIHAPSAAFHIKSRRKWKRRSRRRSDGLEPSPSGRCHVSLCVPTCFPGPDERSHIPQMRCWPC